ncbi:MAG TPA: hypothetical protein VF145_02220, partial [Chitinophagaceae bacterium]
MKTKAMGKLSSPSSRCGKICILCPQIKLPTMQNLIRRFACVFFVVLVCLASAQVNAQCAVNALAFNGTNKSVVGSPLAGVNSSFTMEFWVNPAATIPSGMPETNAPYFYPGTSGQSYALFPWSGTGGLSANT